MRIEDLKTIDEVIEEELRRDPEFREIWERNALPRAVAEALIDYRAKHGISQRELARRLGWRQPHVCRLEAGDHNPSIETLRTLSEVLGIHINIDLQPPEGQPEPVEGRRRGRAGRMVVTIT